MQMSDVPRVELSKGNKYKCILYSQFTLSLTNLPVSIVKAVGRKSEGFWFKYQHILVFFSFSNCALFSHVYTSEDPKLEWLKREDLLEYTGFRQWLDILLWSIV